ncbi:barstar family protein [Achromobacter xylosoxidans]
MELIIDGSRITSEEDLHDVISNGLALPNWYGRNLDALWDVLTGMVERPLKVIWLNSEQSKKTLPRYEQILSLFREVELQDLQSNKIERFTLEIR